MGTEGGRDKWLPIIMHQKPKLRVYEILFHARAFHCLVKSAHRRIHGGSIGPSPLPPHAVTPPYAPGRSDRAGGIDRLRGFLGFEDSGRLIISPVAHLPSLQKMGVVTEKPVM